MIAVLIYLCSCMIKGLRFSFLLQENENLDVLSGLPYQQALSLNNITITYFTDIFIYWFYKPFVPRQRLIGAIALCRTADFAILMGGFLFLSWSRAGLWPLMLIGTILWGAISFGILVTKYKSLLKKRFAQIFVLSLFGWLLEWLALSVFFLIHRGGQESYFTMGLESLFDGFILGPHLVYRWFFLVHFVIGFAALMLLSYRKE